MQASSKKVRVKDDAKLLIRDTQMIRRKRPCTAFIKLNISKAENSLRRIKKNSSYRGRPFEPGRPGTAPNCLQPCSNNKKLTVCKSEKNSLWRQKEEAVRRRRAEIYAINRILQLKFQADFRASMKVQIVEKQHSVHNN